MIRTVLRCCLLQPPLSSPQRSLSATRKLGRGKPKAGGGVGVRTHYFSLLSYFWNTRWNLGKQTKYAYGLLKDWEICTNLSLFFFFLTVSKVMIIWFTYIPAISGELGPMLMS